MSEKIGFIVFGSIFFGITYLLITTFNPVVGSVFGIISTGFWLTFLGAMGVLR